MFAFVGVFILVNWKKDLTHTIVAVASVNEQRTGTEVINLKYKDRVFIDDLNGCHEGEVIAVGK